jgi:pimeloyl-ACP methyl ester carboxylesterase
MLVEANGGELCTKVIGDPRDPPILLVMGMTASMVWWGEEFCQRLAYGRRFVIRYDHRDTGRSVAYEPGHPAYTVSDLVADAAGVLAAYERAAAHIVGMSMGGALAQLLALDAPDHVLSLVLITTSPATPGERGLPPGQERLQRFLGAVRSIGQTQTRSSTTSSTTGACCGAAGVRSMRRTSARRPGTMLLALATSLPPKTMDCCRTTIARAGPCRRMTPRSPTRSPAGSC